MKHQKLPKGKWFYKVRGSYLPGSWQGWLTYIPFVAYLIWPLIWTANQELSFTARVFIIFPQWITAGVVMTWLASYKS